MREIDIQIYQYDNNGFFIKPIIINNDAELPLNTTKVRPSNGYRPKWDGEKWIEGMTQEEISTLNNRPVEPTTEELQMEYNIDLDYRISLIEMGLM